MPKAPCGVLLATAALVLIPASAAVAAPRRITLDVAQAKQPVDRFFDLSVGADYPGTLIGPDVQPQLRTASTSSASATFVSTPSSTTSSER